MSMYYFTSCCCLLEQSSGSFEKEKSPTGSIVACEMREGQCQWELEKNSRERAERCTKHSHMGSWQLCPGL